MTREATPSDAAAIEAFLADHADRSMFLRSNLAAHGVGGGGAPHACRFWVDAKALGLTGVFAVSEQGNALMQAVDDGLDWQALAALLDGTVLRGMIGAPELVARARAAFGLAATTATLDRIEPFLTLDTAVLRVPPGDTELRAMTDADALLVAEWRGQFLCEAMGAAPGPATQAAAFAQAERLIASPQARLLCRGAEPVAMTAFNATVPGIVQIGAVFTPPALRGQGHARRAVALHVAQARARGVTRAVLSAASASAARAYAAIGFRQAGRTHLLDFGVPARVSPPPHPGRG